MQYKRFLVWALLTLLVVFGVGCEDDDLTAEEVFMETINATEGINATAFEMEMTQRYSIPGLGDMSIDSFASGKAIENPMEAEFDMEVEAGGETFYLKIYSVDNLLYMNLPEIGWVWADISEEVAYADSYEDPFAYLNLLQDLSADSITLEEENGQYILTYTDDTGKLAAELQEEVEAQFKSDIFGDVATDPELQEMMGTLEFSNLLYQVKVDLETFLPVENTIAFKTTMDMMGKAIEVDQDIKIIYLEFDTFDSIEVPETVINEAIAMDDIFQ